MDRSSAHKPNMPNPLSREYYLTEMPKSQENSSNPIDSQQDHLANTTKPVEPGSAPQPDTQPCIRDSEETACPNLPPGLKKRLPTQGDVHSIPQLKYIHHKLLQHGRSASNLEPRPPFEPGKNTNDQADTIPLAPKPATFTERGTKGDAETKVVNEARSRETGIDDIAGSVVDQHRDEDGARATVFEIIWIGDEGFEMTRESMGKMVWDTAQLQHFEGT